MEETAEKTSTWLALRNPVFRRLWLAMVISGSCIGAHNTAVYWAMHKLGASTLHIALMTTVSALPYTLFTLPAGAIADMVDRKKILLTVQIWHASIAFALAILWMAHLLNPYLIRSAHFFSALVSRLVLRLTPRSSRRWFPKTTWPLHILSPECRWISRGLSGLCFQRSCFRWPE
jgi:MFS family permease